MNIGDVIVLEDEDEADEEALPLLALVQAIWQTGSAAPQMQVGSVLLSSLPST